MKEKENIFVAQKSYPRLDAFLAEMLPQLSKNKVKSLIQENKVLLNGNPTRAGILIDIGDIAELLEMTEVAIPGERKKTDKKLEVLFEDEHIIIANKERGMSSVLHSAEDEITVADLACIYCESCKDAADDVRDGGLVQRLDYWTSGGVIISKTKESFIKFRDLIKQDGISKSYLAVVENQRKQEVKKVAFEVNKSLKLTKGGSRVEVKDFVEFEEKDIFQAKTKLELAAELERGFLVFKASGQSMRRHQVRAHLSFAGFPLVGDELYESRRKLSEITFFKELGYQGFFLHASTLSFRHPFSFRNVSIKIPSELEKNGLIKQ
ncbi:MAG: RluA family pseudouridine synthase [Proteobacteria bacterium]|nr:RluA family pseudouridine synthase [Pseudomonadota bacterium]